MEHAMQWLHNHTRACWSTFLYTDFQSCDLVKIDLLAFFQFPGSKMEISMQWNDFLITPGQVHLHFLCYCCFHFLCLMCFMYLFPMRSNSAIVSYLLLLLFFFKQKKNECRYNLQMSKYWIQKLFQSLVQKFFFCFHIFKNNLDSLLLFRYSENVLLFSSKTLILRVLEQMCYIPSTISLSFLIFLLKYYFYLLNMITMTVT